MGNCFLIGIIIIEVFDFFINVANFTTINNAIITIRMGVICCQVATIGFNIVEYTIF